MLMALMDGRALTATELARVAGITPQTASGHLAQLTGAGLLAVERQGRHRYHRLASPAVAHMLEGIMSMANSLDGSGPAGRKKVVTGPRRSEEHTSELQSLMRISYAVFCLKKKKKTQTKQQ